MVPHTEADAQRRQASRRRPEHSDASTERTMVETELLDRNGRRENPADIKFQYACNHLGRKGLRDALDLVEYTIRGQYKDCFYKGSSSGYELETFDTQFENGSLLQRLPRLLQRADEMTSTVPLSSLITAWQWKPIIQLAALFSPEVYEDFVKNIPPAEMVILVAARLETAGFYDPIERMLKWAGGCETWTVDAETDDEVREVLGRYRRVRQRVGERGEYGAIWGT